MTSVALGYLVCPQDQTVQARRVDRVVNLHSRNSASHHHASHPPAKADQKHRPQSHILPGRSDTITTCDSPALRVGVETHSLEGLHLMAHSERFMNEVSPDRWIVRCRRCGNRNAAFSTARQCHAWWRNHVQTIQHARSTSEAARRERVFIHRVLSIMSGSQPL